MAAKRLRNETEMQAWLTARNLSDIQIAFINDDFNRRANNFIEYNWHVGLEWRDEFASAHHRTRAGAFFKALGRLIEAVEDTLNDEDDEFRSFLDLDTYRDLLVRWQQRTLHISPGKGRAG